MDAVTVGRWTGRETRVLRTALRLSIRDFAERLGVGVRTVSRWESGGMHVCPRPEMQAVLDTALSQAPAETKTRFSRLIEGRKDLVREGATDRRELLAGGLGVSGLAVLATADAAAMPAAADDDQLLMLLPTAYRRLEQRVPTRLLVAPVAAHLFLIRQLIADVPTGSNRYRRLCGVLSETAGLAAWLYVDLDERANARQHYQVAVRAAHRTGHPLLPAYMQASLGQFAAWSGDVAQGLRLIAEVRSWLRQPPPLASIWLDTIEASALAEYGDLGALNQLDRVEVSLETAQRDEPTWPWIFRFDAAKLAGYRAVAAAKLGRLQTAESAFLLAAASPSSPKQRASMEVERARAVAAAGDLAAACTIAVAALDTGRRAGSHRVVHAVGRFRAGLGSRAGRAVEELDQRLHTTYQEEL